MSGGFRNKRYQSAMTASGLRHLDSVIGERLPAEAVLYGFESVPLQSADLILRAPWLTPCYIGDPDASAALWRGGWMHTQDIATMAPDGIIRVRDRLKDVIKSGGEWIDA